ncbi:hypothetical protein PIB30_047520 [Stylosanthes scabra]|uniref:Uncharacterized protein n=1 Tax=Stylosanthes scabra TaxID=79078 RepID=A0ABU6XFJ8_9FABA|nr:hypothetical protein [Stylosanthes scabra]
MSFLPALQLLITYQDGWTSKTKKGLKEHDLEQGYGKSTSDFGAKSRKGIIEDLDTNARGIEVAMDTWKAIEGPSKYVTVSNSYPMWHKGIGRLCLYIEDEFFVSMEFYH